MKNNRITIFILSLTLVFGSPFYYLFAQEPEEMVNNKQRMQQEGEQNETDTDSVKVIAGTDTTSISIGNRRILIIEKNGETDISISDRTMPEPDNNDNRRKRPFKGNWRGLELGLNNYLSSSFSFSLDQDDDFMELRAARSRNVNLNILQYDFGISGNNIGLVTGLGFEINNYRFSDNVSITKANREIVPVEYDEMGIKVERSRLRTYYLTVPLLIEFQSNHLRQSRRVYFSTGVIGGLNIGSNTRVVYRDNTGKNRDKVRDDFYLAPFRYGLTLRAGYRSLNLFANYYPTPLFQKDKGPELYPVAVGFSILGF